MNPIPRLLSVPLAILAAGLSQAPAQGLHIQMYSCQNPYVNGKDSVLTQVNAAGGKIRRWAQVDLGTKEWRYVNDSDFKDYLGYQAMRSATEGIMVYGSNPNKMWKTTDGWKTAKEVTDKAAEIGFSQVKVTDAGYVGMEYTTGGLYFSADGEAWSLSLDIASKPPPFDAKGNDVFVLSGGSQQYVSTDGGKTFAAADKKDGQKGTKYLGMKMISKDSIMYATDLSLMSTADGGKTDWTVTDFPATARTVWWRNAKEIWYTDAGDKVRKSIDGGATWKEMPSAPGGEAVVPNLVVGDDLYAWPYYKSTDGGDTWKEFLPQYPLASPFFAADFRGSFGVIGKAKGEVFFSYDRGRSFTRKDTVGPQDVFALKILSNGDIVAGDRNGQVFYSADSGRTWANKLSNSTGLNAGKFQTSSNEDVILMTRGGQPVVSTDHGKTFDYVQVAGGSAAQTVKPNGDLVQAAGTILNGVEIASFTAKGVRTPSDTISGDESALDMATVDDKIGYLVTYSAGSAEFRVHKTTDGWVSVSKTGSIKIAAFTLGANARIQAIGSDTVLVSSDGKASYYASFDGGKTFAEKTLGAPSAYPTLKRAWFFNGKEAVFALNDNGIWLDAGSKAGGTGIRYAISRRAIRPFPAWYDAGAKAIRFEGLDGKFEVRIHDCFGRLVEEVPGWDAAHSLKVPGLQNGLYFLSIKDAAGKVSVARIVKR
jgi:hypothetical protein